MTSRRLRRRARRPVPVDAGRPYRWTPDPPPGGPAPSPPAAPAPFAAPAPPAGPAGDEPERRHEALVCVRLTTATPGSHLLEYLRTEPCAVDAWWIAADVDAIVRLSAASLTVLHRAVADLRRRGGAEVVATHSILRPLDLSAGAGRPATTTPAPVAASA